MDDKIVDALPEPGLLVLLGVTHADGAPEARALAAPVYERFCSDLETLGASVHRGAFGADMVVRSANDGPVTLLLEQAQLNHRHPRIHLPTAPVRGEPRPGVP